MPARVVAKREINDPEAFMENFATYLQLLKIDEQLPEKLKYGNR